MSLTNTADSARLKYIQEELAKGNIIKFELYGTSIVKLLSDATLTDIGDMTAFFSTGRTLSVYWEHPEYMLSAISKKEADAIAAAAKGKT